MPVYSFGDLTPQIHPDAFVAENATIVGNVVLEAGSSVWYGCVLRSEFSQIVIGEGSNVQDTTVMHTDPGVPLVVGKGVTIGHAAMIHGATLEDGCLIGLHATVLNGAVVGAQSLVAAGALVKEGQQIPRGVLAAGVPAKVVRELDDTAKHRLVMSAEHYVDNAKNHNTKRVRLA
ncbi:MAG TPA: gamma carbonic anhydrase family protein [Acidimicrobiales bacterium]|nr:gamma carbonic anhydrase family protein [Acidimicrobiales bacterium]